MSSSQNEEGNNRSTLAIHAPRFINMYSRLSGEVKYMECVKNHATSIGGSATDGCGEFMAGGKPGTLEALKCCACNCHRNFHRRIHMPHELEQQPSWNNINYTATTAGASASVLGHVSDTLLVGGQKVKNKIQSRTKRKDACIERCGWKLQRVDDSAVRSFFQEIGIEVLKIWIHNNKYHLPNKNNTTTTTTTTTAT